MSSEDGSDDDMPQLVHDEVSSDTSHSESDSDDKSQTYVDWSELPQQARRRDAGPPNPAAGRGANGASGAPRGAATGANGAAGGAAGAGIRPGFLNNQGGRPAPQPHAQGGRATPQAPGGRGEPMGRVMAEPGRGPHDKLSKALEGIGKLKGDKIEEKRKNFPCNQTALQAVVSCLHAGPSWGFPGDENLQAPLEQDMKQIMRLTEQLGNQPGAVRIGQGSEGLKQLLTRSRIVRTIKEVMFLHMRCYSLAAHKAWDRTWNYHLRKKIPVQHDVVAMGNITWLWMKRHQFVTLAEREFNVSSILIEDLCAAEDWAVRENRLQDPEFRHHRWLCLDMVRLWCSESWPAYSDMQRYPELAREDRQGFSIAYELVERAKRKIQDQEVWYRWLRALVDTNNAMSGQVMNRTFKTLCHEQHRIDPRLKADGWECFKALFVELNNGRNQFVEQDPAEAKKKLVSSNRNGDCNVKLIQAGLKGRKISWSYPQGGVRLYGTVVEHCESTIKIKHDEPFQDLDHPKGELVNSWEWADVAFDMMLHEEYDCSGMRTEYDIEIDESANLSTMVGILELCRIAVEVYDERIHLSAKGLIITLAGASDEFAGIIHGKLSTASNFNRREGVLNRIETLRHKVIENAKKNADHLARNRNVKDCLSCKSPLSAVSGQFAPRVFRTCRDRAIHVYCLRCVRDVKVMCSCFSGRRDNPGGTSASPLSQSWEYFGLMQKGTLQLGDDAEEIAKVLLEEEEREKLKKEKSKKKKERQKEKKRAEQSGAEAGAPEIDDTTAGGSPFESAHFCDARVGALSPDAISFGDAETRPRDTSSPSLAGAALGGNANIDEHVELEFFHDTFTMEMFEDPVVASDGHTYERREIERYFDKMLSAKSEPVSPFTSEKLKLTLRENIALRKAIEAYKKRVLVLGDGAGKN